MEQRSARPQASEQLIVLILNHRSRKNLFPNSILHAFERLLVYTSWANGYDFRISQIQTNNGFVANFLNRLLRSVETDLTQTKLRDLVKMIFKKIKVIIAYRLKIGKKNK